MKGFAFVIFVFVVSTLFAQKSSLGKIKGNVFNAENNEPVPFANIAVWETNKGTVSDINGNFTLEDLTPGFVELRVSAVGFETYISSDLFVTNANTINIDIPLQAANIKLEEVVVQASPYRRSEESPVSLRRIGIAEIEKNPGGNRDISRVIQSLPGVASTPTYRNDVIVRGGGASENQFYLDGVEIPNINHFATQGASGGPVGIINVDFISEVEFYSSAFPASRGNALSSVLEFKQIDGNSEKLKFKGAVGSSDLALTLDGPINDKTTYIMSLRRSYLQFLFAALELPFLPTYNDAQFKIKHKINDKSELTLIGLGALDKSVLNTEANETPEQRYILKYLPENEQWNYTVGAVYKRFKKNGYESFIVSRNSLSNIAYKHKNNNEDSARIFDYNSVESETKFRYERSSRLNNDIKIQYGLGTEYAEYKINTKNIIYTNNELTDKTYSGKLSLINYGAFIQVSKKFINNRLSLSLGTRADGSNYSNEMNNPIKQISPRFSASYMLNKNWFVNFNTGRYYQHLPYTALGLRDSTGTLINKQNNIEYIASNHFVGGIEFLPDEHSKITVEGFYKMYEDYPFSINDGVSISGKSAGFGVFGDEEVLSLANGRTYGLEILARTRNWFGITGILSYTLVRSEFKDYDANYTELNNYIPTAWDNRHILNVTATRNFKSNWDAGFRWRFVGGAPYTPYNLTISENRAVYDASGGPVLDYSRFNGLRLKSFHQLDVRVDKSFYFNNCTFMLYLDIQNIYNFKSDAQDEYINEDLETGEILIQNPNIPYEQQTYQLNKIPSEGQGTVLPTLGIIVQF